MSKTYCDVLGADRVHDIAFSACYSLRSGKASDARPECEGYASAVVTLACKRTVGKLTVSELESACCKHVRDPWGSDIGLGWLGLFINADANCGTDCPRIAANTKSALDAAAEGAESAGNFGISGGKPLTDVVNDILGNKEEDLDIDVIIETQLKLQMLNIVSNMFRPNPYTTVAKMMYSMIQPLMMIMMVNVLMNALKTVV